MITGSTVTATIAKDGTTSGVADLGRPYERVLIAIPTIDSATVSLQVAETTGGTYRVLHYFAPEAATSQLWATTAGTGGIEVVCEHLGGFEFVKVVTGAAQTSAAVTFSLRGIRS